MKIVVILKEDAQCFHFLGLDKEVGPKKGLAKLHGRPFAFFLQDLLDNVQLGFSNLEAVLK